MWKSNSEYRVVTYIIVNPGRLFDFTMLLHDDISLLWESIMGPRTDVDAVGGEHERFFEAPNFFSTVRFGSPPFWIARFGAPVFGPPVLDRPVLDRTPVLDRLFWTAHLLVQFSPRSSVRLLSSSPPHGSSWHQEHVAKVSFLLYC